MKKFIIGTITFLFVFGSFMTISNAATKDELLTAVTKKYTVAGQEVGLSESDIVKVKRYLSENTISAQNADAIIQQINVAVNLMNKEGTADISKLSKAKKDELLNIAKNVASLAGTSLTYDAKDKSILIYKDGKLYDSISNSSYKKFTQSGSSNMIYVVFATAIIAIAGVAGYRKMKVNA